jgi:hypothetical protein
VSGYVAPDWQALTSRLCRVLALGAVRLHAIAYAKAVSARMVQSRDTSARCQTRAQANAAVADVVGGDSSGTHQEHVDGNCAADKTQRRGSSKHTCTWTHCRKLTSSQQLA